jgi:hypothetical protein
VLLDVPYAPVSFMQYYRMSLSKIGFLVVVWLLLFLVLFAEVTEIDFFYSFHALHLQLLLKGPANKGQPHDHQKPNFRQTDSIIIRNDTTE